MTRSRGANGLRHQRSNAISQASETPALPAEIARLLDGTRLEQRTGHVFELLTVSDAGWPHVALLSVGELLAVGANRLMMALWPTTNTTANVRRSGRAVLQLYHDGAAYRTRLDCRGLDDALVEGTQLAVFDCRVEQVQRDAVHYANLTSGPRIELADRRKVVDRWAATIAVLRELSRAGG